MPKNDLKIAWRNLIKNKGYSALNIGGLAVGMAVAMLIGLWIYDELSFNKYHKNYDGIAQIWAGGKDPAPAISLVLWPCSSQWEPQKITIDIILNTSDGFLGG